MKESRIWVNTYLLLILILDTISNIGYKDVINNICTVSVVGQLITGPSDVGGQCPSPTNKYTSRFGIKA